MAIKPLAALLAYQHDGVINRFRHENPSFDTSQLKQDFSDLLAWLWLSVQRKENSHKTFLFGPLIHLDHLWHTFILHTRDYHEFCSQYFGEYVHHDVEPPGTEHQMSEDDLRNFLSDAYDLLGEAWVSRWFC